MSHDELENMHENPTIDPSRAKIPKGIASTFKVRQLQEGSIEVIFDFIAWRKGKSSIGEGLR